VDTTNIAEKPNGTLVLTRKARERLVLRLPDGRTVEVLVVGIRGDKVRLGLLAPRDITIDRVELDTDKRKAVR
jgi:carbon storage regulator CsrA